MRTLGTRGDRDQRGTVPMPAEVTVHEVHHRVCNARTRHGVHGPGHAPHHGRRRTHLPVSQYRARARAGVVAGPPEAAPTDVRQHQLVLQVLTSAAALGVLYLLAIRVLDPGLDNRLVLLGALLIATAAAVVLNAISVDAANRTGRNARH